MNDRVVLRVLCSRTKKPHTVGTVVAAADGYRLDWMMSVRGVEGYRPDGFAASVVLVAWGASSEAWCSSCRMALPLDPLVLLRAIEGGRTAIRLEARGMHVNPLGVLDRANRRKED